jgi:hypothetical protein
MLERLHTVPKDRALLAGADLMQSMVVLDRRGRFGTWGTVLKGRRTSPFSW